MYFKNKIKKNYLINFDNFNYIPKLIFIYFLLFCFTSKPLWTNAKLKICHIQAYSESSKHTFYKYKFSYINVGNTLHFKAPLNKYFSEHTQSTNTLFIYQATQLAQQRQQLLQVLQHNACRSRYLLLSHTIKINRECLFSEPALMMRWLAE